MGGIIIEIKETITTYVEYTCGTIGYENGDVYTGEIHDVVPHGHGKFIYV